MKLVALKNPVVGEVELPVSKSIANRLLILGALSNTTVNLPKSLPEDVKSLKNGLSSNSDTIDIGMAGTAMRFLTAYFSVKQGKEVILTGDARMKQRPISELVNALKTLGADIFYLEDEGFPPLRIAGKALKGGEISISGSVSSQFVSAIMMVGPYLKNGLKLQIQSDILSRPYIELTADCMRKSGAEVEVSDRFISIPAGKYSTKNVAIESDWSAASYFYALAYAKPGSRILLKGLRLDSAQGDSILKEWFEPLGVVSTQLENGVEIVSVGLVDFPTEIDFRNYPDLAQTFAFLAATLGKELKLTGLDNLRIKETDRIAALQSELEKLGLEVLVSENTLHLKGTITVETITIETYNDHRMAMSASVLSCVIPTQISNSKVVIKSFPKYWEEVVKLIGNPLE